jgi:archaemetzincin
MSTIFVPPKSSSTCDHSKLVSSPSSNASLAGYKRPNLSQRIAATTPQGTAKGLTAKNLIGEENSPAFPAPLVLPDDELSWDPKHPPQSLRSWIREKDRNAVAPERRTIYLAAPPDTESGLEFIQEWTQPQLRGPIKEKRVDFPRTKDVLSYLEAFYHGLPVKMLAHPHPCFTTDVNGEVMDSPPAPKEKPKTTKTSTAPSPTLWLNTHTPSGCIGIRSRATPSGPFTHQLNLNDLLDAAIDMLPSDAYALLLLVQHDIFEDEDDDFACGRAYGGSRIAVVSGARYDPVLDALQALERGHAWPASHCAEYVRGCCGEVRRDSGGDATSGGSASPMRAAVAAHVSLPCLERAASVAALEGLWLGRLCRTASHELGHCFGIDHCVYYACAMQGTASVVEDARQPPYLCPIDLAKVLKATGADERDRYRSLLEFCERNKEVHLFAAYGAWIYRILEMERVV